LSQPQLTVNFRSAGAGSNPPLLLMKGRYGIYISNTVPVGDIHIRAIL
jgi:hypothetical protein